jgi:hypothetical protein
MLLRTLRRYGPRWARIAFSAVRLAQLRSIRKLRIAPGKPPLVVTTNDLKFQNDWSRDGRFLLYTQQDAGRKPIYGSCH